MTTATEHRNRVLLGMKSDWALDLALLTVIVLHGPIDVVFTTAAWYLESNPVTLMFGIWTWVLVKIIAVSLPVFVWWMAKMQPWHRDSALFFFGLWSGGALAVVVLNLFEVGVLP